MIIIKLWELVSFYSTNLIYFIINGNQIQETSNIPIKETQQPLAHISVPTMVTDIDTRSP